ncbi:precorrin-8X methylmutase [Propylenella binzhouense]|uniref:Precorrin-8X methylmutase n=1 Tax=Propylenella binzhouense TaxID=2555902 RepID=A0A964T469_9HYPH|nr:precorrin-8X methylmutase [Propylenella binzhouense]
MSPYDYLCDPAAIGRRSFEIIRTECDFSRLTPVLASVAERVVHASGMPDVVSDLRFSPGAAEAGREALLSGAAIVADVRMVAAGVTRSLLPAGNEVLVALDACPPGEALSGTRSAAGMERLSGRIGGAVIAIGNAPTALFRLLEMVAAGAPKPALVLGFPVGFVGAAESKEALVANGLGIPYVALSGRRGGSAMAAAAVNALALGRNAP